ncbi:MAG: M12 family metallo-peptidase [Aquimonas sp.]|nr:M12 family metallo-peptidase [Aquimonas sp.]
MSTLSRVLVFLACCLMVQPAGANDARILAFETLAFDAVPSRGQPSAVERFAFSAFGQAFELELTSNARLLDALDATVRASAIGTDNLFLHGAIVGNEGSWARLSRIDGRWTGGFHDGRELYLMDAAEKVATLLPRHANPGSTVLYRMSDLVMPRFHGGIVSVSDAYKPTARGADYARFVDHLQASVGLAGTATRELGITVVTDTEYSAVHGGDANAVTASQINMVDGIYSAQLGIRITATHVSNLRENGPLAVGNDPVQVLQAFQAFMFDGAGSAIPKGGLNQLFTGRVFDFGVLGIAVWNPGVGVLCDPERGYAASSVVVANNISVIVIAHEIGHNFAAPHDGEGGSACAAQAGSWLMSPNAPLGTTTFSPCSLAQIAAPIQAATCITPTAEIIFRDAFESPMGAADSL